MVHLLLLYVLLDHERVLEAAIRVVLTQLHSVEPLVYQDARRVRKVVAIVDDTLRPGIRLLPQHGLPQEQLQDGPELVPCLRPSRWKLFPTYLSLHIVDRVLGSSSVVGEGQAGHDQDALLDHGRIPLEVHISYHPLHTHGPTQSEGQDDLAGPLSPSRVPALPSADDTSPPPSPPTLHAPFRALSFPARCEAVVDECSPMAWVVE